MSKSSRSGFPNGDYLVGYKRPPAATRFKPGCSGNPRGRTRKPMDVASVLNRALDVRIPIQENGRRRIITMREAIIRGLVNDAARREPKAMRMLFALMTRHPGDAGALHTGALATEDQAILADFLAKYSTPGAQKNHLAGPEDAPDLIQTDGDDGGS